MKMRVKFALLLMACLSIMLLAGCEKPAEYSTETVVCRFSWGGGYGTIYDTIDTNIVVYADNTVRVYTGPFYDNWLGIEMDEICSRTYTITEEQKLELIRIMERNRVNSIGDCSDDGVLDGCSYYINLYDAAGEEIVYTCGGYAANNVRFWNVGHAVRELVPEGELQSIKEESITIAEGAWNDKME